MKSKLYLGLLFIINFAVCFSQNNDYILKICVDNNNWRPFVYHENGEIKGIHIDTVSEALNHSKILFKLIPSPWKRCLKGSEKGMFDAIATASFNNERAEYLFYPDAAQQQLSPLRVGQVQYNIIVHQSTNYDFQEELTDIPKPIRVPRNYSIGNDLKAMGFFIDDSSISDFQNLKRLIREKNGSVVTLPSIAIWANQQQQFKGKIRLIKKPIKSKSYFLAFSKKGHVDIETAKKIWQQIQIVRERNQHAKYIPNKEH